MQNIANYNTYKNNFTVIIYAKPNGTTTTHAQSTTGAGACCNDNSKYLIYPEWGTTHGNNYAGVGVNVGTNAVEIVQHADGYMPAVLSMVLTTAEQANYINGMIITVRYTNKIPYLKISDIYGGNIKTQTRSDNNTNYDFYLPYGISCGSHAYYWWYDYYRGYVGNIYYYNSALSDFDLNNVTFNNCANNATIINWNAYQLSSGTSLSLTHNGTTPSVANGISCTTGYNGNPTYTCNNGNLILSGCQIN